VDSDLLMTAIGVMTSGLCLLLAVFLLAVRGPLRPANRFLAGFLLLTAVDLVGWAWRLFPAGLQEWLIFRQPLGWLQAPLFYVYAAALCFPGRPVRAHLIGGVAAVAISALSLIPRALAMASGAPFETDLDLVANSVAGHLQYYAYAAAMIVLLVRYRQAYRRTRSNPDDVTFVWLAAVLGVSLAAHSLVLAKSVAGIADRAAAYSALDVVVGLVAVAISCALTLTALFKQDLFLGVSPEPDAPARPESPAPPARPDPAEALAIARLEAFMAAQEPFLDPSLTVRGLARRLGMGQRELSILINQRMGVHFFDFVNRYRIDKAAALLADPAMAGASVLEIALQSGFNTKSSFNAAFSRHRGETPTAHRLRARVAA
jgi:AraC-like DNA-binding protein